MAFKVIDRIGIDQDITEVSTTQKYPFGTRVRCKDTTNNAEAEFTYVKGITSAAVGLVCTFNPSTGVTALGAARAKGLIGVFVSVLDAATKFGWVQTGGIASVETLGDVAAGATVYLGANAKVDDAVVAGDIVYGANFTAARTGAGLVNVTLCHPWTGDTDAT